MIKEISDSEFIRLFTVQYVPNLIFFLGAGASISSGIPSAKDMIWQFKREIYCTEKNVSKENFRDLTVDYIRIPLQRYIEKKSWYSGEGTPNEYGMLFEKCYPDERARRNFIQNYIRDASVNLGYKCLGALLKAKKITNLITTNFDNLIERSIYPYSDIPLFIISPESESRLNRVSLRNSDPQLFKLHGDFLYDNIQNTPFEVQKLNENIQKKLLEFFREYGLVFIGYSGRDNSVMEMLDMASKDNECFRNGFYWCMLEEEGISSRIMNLLEQISGQGNPCLIVRIKDFDEFIYKLYKQSGLQENEIEDIAQRRFEQRTPFEILKERSASSEIIKTNAILVKEFPTTLYKFDTDLINWNDLRLLIGSEEIIACLYKNSVLALGNISLIQSIFNKNIKSDITTFNTAPYMLEKNRGFIFYIYYSLVNNCLIKRKKLLLCGKHIFYVTSRNGSENYVFKYEVDQSNIAIPLTERYQSRSRTGEIFYIHPGFSYKLQYHDNKLYFILRPEVVLTSDKINISDSIKKKTVINEIISKRYNNIVHNYLLFWLDFLKNESGELEFMFPVNSEPPVCKMVLEKQYSFSSRKI